MRFHNSRRHMIDFLFPVALFFVFALSAVTLILLAAGVYRSTTERSSLNYTSRTALSYISEKIHQSDADGSIYPGSFDGCDALIMEQSFGESTYVTYIYAHDGAIKELFIRDGVDAKASDGQTILEVESFSIHPLSDDLLEFECTDQNMRHSSAIVGIRSASRD